MSRVHFDREFPAPLRGHAALQTLGDAGDEGAVVLEELSAVFDLDAAPLAKEFVVRALVDVLEAAPATDVVDENVIEVGLSRLNVVDQLDETRPPLDSKAAAAFVGIGADDRESVRLGIGGDGCELVLDRVALKLPRHSDVLRCPARSGPSRQARPLGDNKPITHAPLPLLRGTRASQYTLCVLDGNLDPNCGEPAPGAGAAPGCAQRGWNTGTMPGSAGCESPTRANCVERAGGREDSSRQELSRC